MENAIPTNSPTIEKLLRCIYRKKKLYAIDGKSLSTCFFFGARSHTMRIFNAYLVGYVLFRVFSVVCFNCNIGVVDVLQYSYVLTVYVHIVEMNEKQ